MKISDTIEVKYHKTPRSATAFCKKGAVKSFMTLGYEVFYIHCLTDKTALQYTAFEGNIITRKLRKWPDVEGATLVNDCVVVIR